MHYVILSKISIKLKNSPDTNNPQTATSQFPAAPCDAVALHRSTPTRTWKEFHHRQCPCTGTNIRWLWHASCPLQRAGTTQSLCSSFGDRWVRSASFDCGLASRNPKKFARSYGRRELKRKIIIDKKKSLTKNRIHKPNNQNLRNWTLDFLLYSVLTKFEILFQLNSQS